MQNPVARTVSGALRRDDAGQRFERFEQIASGGNDLSAIDAFYGALRMNLRLLVTTAILSGLLMAPLAQAMPQHHHDAATTSSAPLPAQRWAPDAPLREGMRRAQTAVGELHHYELGHMSETMALDRARTVADAVTFMFAHCKLAAEPDEALHGILVPLLSAAQALQADPKKVQAVAEMRAAIDQYPHYFNDPGWNKQAPAHSSAHDE